MKFKILLVVVLIALIFIACENLNDPGELKFKHSILFNLSSGISKQKLYIYNISSLGAASFGYLKEYDKYFDPNAAISIESNGSIISDFYIESDSDNVRYYTSESLNLFSGAEYKLTIKIGEEEISGTTIIPGTFQIISPIENQVIPYTTSGFNVNYKWTSCIGSYGYLIQITYPFVINGVQYEEALSHYDKLTDTLYNFNNYLEPVDTVYSIISAYDKNYYEHIFLGKESSGITGAYGYFGSSTQTRLKYIVR